ncbi:hypothetical protein PoB_000115600 [Plakobranchus ocellatus]|uniref:Ig-like domain-containing protein n=1 Tax=Plakobranchus ocellatus TaxID=259542 RepID=A0AAV3XX48_9GAST|nr:hypothetical protein PoB_000115600 [Plakobranchus ocellatus]
MKAKHEVYTKAGLTMYSSELKTQINGKTKAMPGHHTTELTVYPDVPFLNEEKLLMASLRKIIVSGRKAYVTLDVLQDAEIVTFTINREKRKFEASEGEIIKLRCSALGNPKPPLNTFSVKQRWEKKRCAASNFRLPYRLLYLQRIM